MSKVAVVTGGTSGIGKQTALALKAAGYTVYELSRRAQGVEGLHHLVADITREELVDRLRSLSLYARKGMTDRGLKIRESALNAPTPIIPIYTYETYHTLEVAKEIYDRGVYVNPTLPPATPEGEALLRTSYMATHTEALLDEAMDIMAEVLVKHE